MRGAAKCVCVVGVEAILQTTDVCVSSQTGVVGTYLGIIWSARQSMVTVLIYSRGFFVMKGKRGEGKVEHTQVVIVLE